MRETVYLDDARAYKTERGAVNATIRKWEKIVRLLEKGFTVGNYNDSSCALCQMYVDCIGCPVRKKTERTSCYGTPYYDFRSELVVMNYKGAIAQAKQMVEFLKGIRK